MLRRELAELLTVILVLMNGDGPCATSADFEPGVTSLVDHTLPSTARTSNLTFFALSWEEFIMIP